MAAELGVDAIGLNFVGGPRRISTDMAFQITRILAPFVSAVALVKTDTTQFADALELAQILAVYPRLPIYTFQLYGAGPEHFLDRDYHLRKWMVSSISDRASFVATVSTLYACNPNMPDAVVLDAASTTKLGGTGRAFNWEWIAEARAAGELARVPPIILAGGLTPENVAEAIRIAHPYAVDVSSGVEVAGQPGIKDPVKMRDFIQAVRGADA